MGVHALTVAPFNVGDLLVLAFWANGGPVTAVSGGGVSKWTCASSYYDTTGSAYLGIWWGVVTGTGTSTITVTDPGLGTNYGTVWAWEFTATGANWTAAAASPTAGTTGGTPGTSGTPVDYPALSPTAGETTCISGRAGPISGT